MDTVIAALKGWHQRLAIVLRLTGLRCQQPMGLRCSDLDLERGRLTVRGELGKSRQEQRDRILPPVEHIPALRPPASGGAGDHSPRGEAPGVRRRYVPTVGGATLMRKRTASSPRPQVPKAGSTAGSMPSRV